MLEMSTIGSKYHRPVRKSAKGGFAYSNGGKHFVEVVSACNNGSAITINVVDSDIAREAACLLINRCYSPRGYGGDHAVPSGKSSLTFAASAGQAVFATLTLGIDTGIGLAADDCFRDQIDKFRSKTRAKLCELTKLAVDTAAPPKELLAAIFHFAFIYGGHHHTCTDLFIEVNPRHRRFYETMLGFAPIGDVRINARVAAPAQLMHLDISNVRVQLDDENRGYGSARNRSLYPFFFSPDDESTIAAHVRNDG